MCVFLSILTLVVGAWLLSHIRLARPHEWLLVPNPRGGAFVYGTSCWLWPGSESEVLYTTVSRLSDWQTVTTEDGHEVTFDWTLHVHVPTREQAVRSHVEDLMDENPEERTRETVGTLLSDMAETFERAELIEEREAWQRRLRENLDERLEPRGLEVILVSTHLQTRSDDELQTRSVECFAALTR